MTNGIVTTQLEYTQRGDVAVERTIVDGLSFAVQYQYDAAGNRTRVQGPSGTRADTSFAGLRPSAATVVAGTRHAADHRSHLVPLRPAHAGEVPAETTAPRTPSRARAM